MRLRSKAYVKERVLKMDELLEVTARDAKALAGVADRTFRKAEKELFRTEGVSGPGKWRALDPAYAKYKRRALGGALSAMREANKQIGRGRTKGKGRTPSLKSVNKILQYSGDLKDSLTRAGHPDHLKRGWRLRNKIKIQLGTQNELAGIHAKGGRNLPQRQSVYMNKKHTADMFDDIKQWFIKTKLKRLLRAKQQMKRVA